MKTLKIIIASMGFIVLGLSSFGQITKSNIVQTESIMVSTNTNFLITGETLYYSVYCLNSENKLSTFSKLAYLELIDENERPVLQSKISLVNGSGGGDFFLPSTLVSGNYTLIAYTKWMRNFPIENFFQKQIVIVNPYVKSLKGSDTSYRKDVDRSVNQKEISQSGLVLLTTDKQKYSQRQKVFVVVKNRDPVHDLTIALNVHSFNKNVEALMGLDSLYIGSFSGQSDSLQKSTPITFLPDLRGETIGGIALDRTSRHPIVNENIYLSAQGNPYVFQMSKTDSSGRFYFTTKDIQGQTEIRFQTENTSESSLDVILDDSFINDYKKFRPKPFAIDTTLRRQIEQRNVYSQIENAYYTRKQDSVLRSTPRPFFGEADRVYNLDDFTRFPTMEDIFREYMFEVVVSKREKKFAIQMLNSRNASRFLNTPLMLIDGIRIFDIDVLMSYNPLLIKKVSLVTRQYVYAGILYDGILSIDTYAGIAKELPSAFVVKNYMSKQDSKKYYSPMYNANHNLARTPDYRVQLFWNPTIHIKAGQDYSIEFYTSDVAGDFLIEAKGYTSTGDPLKIQQHIEVQK